MSKPTEEDMTIRALDSLHVKRHVDVEGEPVEIVLLVHPEGQRPMTAGWWSSKEVSIVGADVIGNFFLRQSDGSVGYWDRAGARLLRVSPSVRDLIASIH